jgi:HK97 gp10 family phage protein
VTVVWKGLRELTKSFNELSAKLKNKVGRSAVSSAANLIKRESIKNARTRTTLRTGTLIKGFVIKRVKTPEGLVRYNIGIKSGGNLYKKGRANKSFVKRTRGNGSRTVYSGDPFYAGFLERGTKVKGQQRIRPRNFIRDAIQSKNQAALDQMVKILNKKLIKESAGKL